MPPSVNEARMIPASENDVINPGSFYLACLNLQRKTVAESYWIVLRTPREWLPDGFFDTRPVQSRVFPFWIVGKDQRVWLPRSSLFNLDPSQRKIYPDRTARSKFAELFNLINSFQDTDAALSHFRQEIVESTDRYNERRGRMDRSHASNGSSWSLSWFVEDDSDGPDCEPSLGITIPLSGSTPRRDITSLNTDSNISGSHRRRRDITNVSSLTNISGSSQRRDTTNFHSNIEVSGSKRRRDTTNFHSNIEASGSKRRRDSANLRGSQSRTPPAKRPKIKTEQDERHLALAETIMTSSRVRIFVGQNNVEFIADIGVLEEKSPVLHSLVASNGDNASRFVMHPMLQEVDPDDFLAVMEFMHSDEYNPAIVSNPDGNRAGPMALDGRSTAREYSDALIQAARLFLLAKTFQIRGMIDLITRKVIRAQYKTYSNGALIEFAQIMFTRAGITGERANAQNGNTTFACVLDRWVVGELADNFIPIMRSNMDYIRYIDMAEATAEQNVHALILDHAAATFRRVGGIPELIVDTSSDDA